MAAATFRWVATETYVSSLCRIGDHDKCKDHPVVICDCACHATPNVRHLGPERFGTETIHRP